MTSKGWAPLRADAFVILGVWPIQCGDNALSHVYMIQILHSCWIFLHYAILPLFLLVLDLNPLVTWICLCWFIYFFISLFLLFYIQETNLRLIGAEKEKWTMQHKKLLVRIDQLETLNKEVVSEHLLPNLHHWTRKVHATFYIVLIL